MIKNLLSQTVPYQIDTVYSPFKASEFEQALDFLSGAGFTGVELAIAYPRKVDSETLSGALAARNLQATTLSTGQIYGLEGVFLASFDRDIRKRAADTIKGHIELSAQLGLPPVTIGLLRGKLEQGDKAALLANFRESMQECLGYAAKYGVILQIEPIYSKETVLINTADEAVLFIESLGYPENCGILYDTYHSFLEDGDMLQTIRRVSNQITNVHLSDSNRGLPGTGEIDFKAVCGELLSAGYSRAFALETLAVPSEAYVREHCYESIAAAVGI